MILSCLVDILIIKRFMYGILSNNIILILDAPNEKNPNKPRGACRQKLVLTH